MLAKPQLATSENLLPSVDYAPEPAGGTAGNHQKVVGEPPRPAINPPKASDPLAHVRSLTDEEIIALFS